MARIGGRNTAFAWFVGVVCAGIVGLLVYLASPMVPVIGNYIDGMLNGG